MDFTIEISDYQRRILATALGGLTSNLSQEDKDELSLLYIMLERLPADEADQPNALHSFCS